MKKFVTVIISFLVLFIFLILNYLLWDKENLLKLRDNDKIEQDWLRGQNRTLQTTVEELEQNVKELNDENDALKDTILDLEQQIRTARENESGNLELMKSQTAALGFYKSFMKEEIQKTAGQWFEDISTNKFEHSVTYLEKDFKLWEKSYDTKQYIAFISAFKSIELNKEPAGDADPFIIIEEQDNPYEISTRVSVIAAIDKERQSELPNLKNGTNTVNMVFQYNSDTGDWVIKSVSAINTGKP